jgi:hypothetical protein
MTLSGGLIIKAAGTDSTPSFTETGSDSTLNPKVSAIALFLLAFAYFGNYHDPVARPEV